MRAPPTWREYHLARWVVVVPISIPEACCRVGWVSSRAAWWKSSMGAHRDAVLFETGFSSRNEWEVAWSASISFARLPVTTFACTSNWSIVLITPPHLRQHHHHPRLLLLPPPRQRRLS